MKYPSELSGGMSKRAGLARALALDPEILFLDEPTAGLDPIGAAAFDELIASLQRSLGLTVFMVTHDLDSLHAICDRIAVLVDKSIIVDTMEALRLLDHPWIREYFHGPRGRAALGAPIRRELEAMETRASYLLVGGFTLVMMACLFGFVVWLAKSSFEEANRRATTSSSPARSPGCRKAARCATGASRWEPSATSASIRRTSPASR